MLVGGFEHVTFLSLQPPCSFPQITLSLLSENFYQYNNALFCLRFECPLYLPLHFLHSGTSISYIFCLLEILSCNILSDFVLIERNRTGLSFVKEKIELLKLSPVFFFFLCIALSKGNCFTKNKVFLCCVRKMCWMIFPAVIFFLTLLFRITCGSKHVCFFLSRASFCDREETGLLGLTDTLYFF